VQYRYGIVTDWPAIAQYVNGKEYFMTVDPTLLGGQWVIAIDDAGVIHGTIWAFHRAPNAYLDYWTADNGRIAAKLGVAMRAVLRNCGITSVRATVGVNNPAARRLAQGLGMLSGDNQYHIIHGSI
jgi:hypothetical protein